jgi:uncharacterized membrane protein
MVLQIPLTNNFSLEGINNLLYSIFIFFISFFIVGFFWSSHHKLFHHIENVSNKLLWKNLVFLFFLALLPIFTKWLLLYPKEFVPVIAYDILFIIIYLSYFFMMKSTNIKMPRNPNHKKRIQKSKNLLVGGLIWILTIIMIILLFIHIPEVTAILLTALPIIFSFTNLFLEDG